MLSKCLNPQCSATFQYFGQGRLFRIDFAEAGRKRALAGKETVSSIRSKACPIEHFWLCEDCAAVMTIELCESGEVRLLPNAVSARRPVAALRSEARRTDAACEATAS